jgi:threonine-phosphate decarboxylase
MKAPLDLAKSHLRCLQPCVHGADVLDAARQSGFSVGALLDFSSSINPLGMPQTALQAIHDSLFQVSQYPDSSSAALRCAIAKHYPPATPENVVVGNGSTELIYLFADVFLRVGEVALVPAPSFSEYSSAAQKAGGKIKLVSLNKTFALNPNRILNAITKKTKLIYLCNPNNPTSKLIPTQTLTTMVEHALTKDILVFLDEDFLEFVEDDQTLSLTSRINDFPNLFVMRSFTKLYGLTGLRVGYGLCNKDLARVLMNAKLPWNLNCLGQAAAIAALADQEHLKTTWALIKQEKTFLMKNLTRFHVFKIIPPDANFIFLDIRKSGFTAAQLKQKMLQHGILIRDCSSFAGLDPFYIRIAIKNRWENERLLQAFKAILG